MWPFTKTSATKQPLEDALMAIHLDAAREALRHQAAMNTESERIQKAHADRAVAEAQMTAHFLKLYKQSSDLTKLPGFDTRGSAGEN